MRVSAISNIWFNNSEPTQKTESTIKQQNKIKEENKESDYKYPDRPNLLKRVWNALKEDTETKKPKRDKRHCI